MIRRAVAVQMIPLACLLAAALSSSTVGARARVDTFRVRHAYPHDAGAFTQGLIYRDGFLYESTGLNGRSSLRKVKLETGEVVQQRAVDAMYFAEGLTDWGDRLVQLTWQHQLALVYDRASLAPVRTFSYKGEGWGLTHDDRSLILSDGSDMLTFLDPATFRETRRLTVRDGTAPVRSLNELEYVRGEIYANIWHQDRIARISPQTGQVTAWIDLTGLLSPAIPRDREAVLNGIAFDAATGRLFVTGKLWPKLFEIEVVRR